MIGGIRCGCNVYGVERDRVQYDASVTRLTKLVNERGVAIEQAARQAETALSNKRPKVVHGTDQNEEDFVPPTQQPATEPPTNLECPACGQQFEKEDVTDICCADGCHHFKLHKTCLLLMNDKLYCALHVPT